MDRRDKQLGDTTDIDAPLAWLYTPSYSVCRVWLDPSSAIDSVRIEIRSCRLSSWRSDDVIPPFFLFFFSFDYLFLAPGFVLVFFLFFRLQSDSGWGENKRLDGPCSETGGLFFTAAHKSFFSFFSFFPFFWQSRGKRPSGFGTRGNTTCLFISFFRFRFMDWKFHHRTD